MHRGVKTYEPISDRLMRLKQIFPIALIFLSFLIYSCSSTTQSDRYNRPKEEETSSPSSVRFTSVENKDTSTFNNTSDEITEFDEVPIEDYPINKKEFVGKYEKMGSLSSALTTREKILFEVISYLDTPYKYGGVDRNGIDCSAFTQLVFKTSIGLDLPRTASQQYEQGETISSEDNLEFGDLVFFNTTRRSFPGHVGIYIGENLFAHASRSLGVTVSSLQSTYYKNRFVGGRRIK